MGVPWCDSFCLLCVVHSAVAILNGGDVWWCTVSTARYMLCFECAPMLLVLQVASLSQLSLGLQGTSNHRTERQRVSW
jgi:hypothetical protein